MNTGTVILAVGVLVVALIPAVVAAGVSGGLMRRFARWLRRRRSS